MLGCSSSRFSEDADAVGIVNHPVGLCIFFGYLHYGRQVYDIAFHTKNAVDYDKFASFRYYLPGPFLDRPYRYACISLPRHRRACSRRLCLRGPSYR